MKKIYFIFFGVLILGLGGTLYTLKTTPKQVDENKSSLVITKFDEYTKANDIKKIKLIGDSITAGNGLQSLYIPKDSRIIYDHNGEVFQEPSPGFPSWGNFFRKYIYENYSKDVEFINFGIGGKSAKWFLENIDFILDNNEDVVFVMLGTNDRSETTLEEYKKNIEMLLDRVNKEANYMIVMSPPPSKNDYAPFNFSPGEIDAVLKDIVKEKNYNFISHYDGINNFFLDNPIYKYEDVMEFKGAHPLVKGYEIMWETIYKELSLKEK